MMLQMDILPCPRNIKPVSGMSHITFYIHNLQHFLRVKLFYRHVCHLASFKFNLWWRENLGNRCFRTQRAPKVIWSSFNLHFCKRETCLFMKKPSWWQRCEKKKESWSWRCGRRLLKLKETNSGTFSQLRYQKEKDSLVKEK